MKIFISVFILFQGFLFAHCDGCDAGNEQHEHGSLIGNVKYEGKVPKARTISMDKDPISGMSHSENVYDDSFIVDENMNFKNVVLKSFRL